MTGKENREIKNSVFVDLFYEDESAEANEIALFNAIHDEPLPEGTKIRKFRVDNTIYMNFQNDISFDAGGKVIVFGEHQSTINENMPLRSLLYIGRAYERLVPPRSRYKKKLVPLPMPEFYTFYNGKELMSRDELAVMDGNKCILQLRGVRPFYSDKFDITKHKRYKQLSDYDKKNEFHVEEYMKHQMEVRLDPEEQFDLYMYEGSELEEQSNNENEGTGHVT